MELTNVNTTSVELVQLFSTSSVTRSGDFLDFGQLFKAFAQISHILRQFL